MNYRQKITLRTFLKSTASYAGAIVVFPYIVPLSAVVNAGAVAASEPITVGFIGTDRHGIAMNLKSFLAQPDAQAVVVCDLDPDNEQFINDEQANKMLSRAMRSPRRL
jgi:hypothetical protein